VRVMVGVGVIVGVEVWVGVRVTVGVGVGEAVGVADGVCVRVAVDVGVWVGISVCVTVGENVGSGDGVRDAVGGMVAEGNLVAVEMGFEKLQEREIRAKIVTNTSKLDLIGLCIDYQSILAWVHAIIAPEKTVIVLGVIVLKSSVVVKRPVT
jgi:hypothetical protein